MFDANFRLFASFSAFGILIGGLLLWGLDAQHSTATAAYYIGAFAGMLIASVPLGIFLARIVRIPILNVVDNSIDRVNQSLSQFAHQGVWPGRRFHDQLRVTRLASTRRDFIKFGLERSFRIAETADAGQMEAIGALLATVEHESDARGRNDLAIIAREARGMLRSLRFHRQIKSLLIAVSYFGFPVALLYVTTALIDGTLSFDGGVLREPNLDGISHFALSSILVLAIPLVVYTIAQMFFFLTWSVGKRTTTQVDDVLLVVLAWTLGLAVGVGLLFWAITEFAFWPVGLQSAARAFVFLFLPVKIDLSDPALHAAFGDLGRHGFSLLRVAVILVTTALLVVLLQNFTSRVLAEMAAATKQTQDDMAVALTRIFGSVMLVMAGAGWVFVLITAEYGTSISPDGGSSLLPFAILAAVLGGLLGLATKDILENFFAGVSLQVDKPFEPGERVELESGQLCEVRSIGMRSTHFYNIIENTDLYLPNTTLARQMVTNLSRPNREYRRTLKAYANDERTSSLLMAEKLILLAAFSVSGVDIPTILDERREGSMFLRNRPGLVAEFSHLQEQFEEANSAIITLHGREITMGEAVSELSRRISRNIELISSTRSKRWDSENGIPVPFTISQPFPDQGDVSYTADHASIEAAADVAHWIFYDMYTLGMAFYTLSGTYPYLREDFQRLAQELLRTPEVNSSHHITDDGFSYWELELRIYSYVTEQSDEVIHHLNLLIQHYFNAFSLLPQGRGRG